MIDSIESYLLRTSMKSIKSRSLWNNLFLKHQPIYTKVKDEPPTHYLKGSSVIQACHGCKWLLSLTDHVENSIISRGVTYRQRDSN